MKKILITENNVNDYIREGKLRVKENLIISPGVFDFLRSRDIEVVYEKSTGETEEDKINNDTKKVENMIREILKEEYNTVDSAVIGNVSKSVMSFIKNN